MPILIPIIFSDKFVAFINTKWTVLISINKNGRTISGNGVFRDFTPYGKFDAADLEAMINSNGTVNVHSEGIAADVDGGFGLCPKAAEPRPIEKLNFLFKVDENAVIEKVVALPDELNNVQLRFGFEGVTKYGDYVVVAFQCTLGEEAHPRLGIYNTNNDTWKFVHYPLDEKESQNGGWVGLSDITSVGNGTFLVLERDNQGGPDAAIKRIYSISLGDLGEVQGQEVVSKTLVRDVLEDMKSFGGLRYEKLEGMAYLNGDVWLANDNDAVSDNTGETQERAIQLVENTWYFSPSAFVYKQLAILDALRYSWSTWARYILRHQQLRLGQIRLIRLLPPPLRQMRHLDRLHLI
ncbi:hypothetical protein ACHAWF_017235 [Thalassiosira exigua]